MHGNWNMEIFYRPCTVQRKSSDFGGRQRELGLNSSSVITHVVCSDLAQSDSWTLLDPPEKILTKHLPDRNNVIFKQINLYEGFNIVLNIHWAHVSNSYIVKGIDLRQCRTVSSGKWMTTSEVTVRKKCSGQHFPPHGWRSGFRKS